MHGSGSSCRRLLPSCQLGQNSCQMVGLHQAVRRWRLALLLLLLLKWPAQPRVCKIIRMLVLKLRLR